MTLTRDVDGFLDEVTFDADTLDQQPAGWTKQPSGVSVSFLVKDTPGNPGFSGRVLRGNSVSGEQSLTRDGTSRQDGVVQGVVMNTQLTNANAQVALLARHIDESNRFDVRLINILDVMRFAERVGGVTGITDPDVPVNLVLNQVYILRVAYIGSTIKARLFLPDETLVVAAERTSSHAPWTGLWGVRYIADNQRCWWDAWRFYANTTVRCTGLPSGHQVQLKKSDETIAAGPVTEVGGEVTIDYSKPFPLAKLEVLDSGGALVEAIAPANGVWGGDEYSFAAAGATQLAFSQQPTPAAVGAVITPAVTVEARTDEGSVDTGFTGDITVALDEPQGAALGGTLTVAAVNGVATFDDLTVGKAGTYQLRATAAGLTDALSDPFTIVAWQSAPAVAGVWASRPPTIAGDELVREVIGLLARHEHDDAAFPFTLAQWTADPGLIALSIVGSGADAGSLQLTAQVTGHRSVARYDALATRTAWLVHAVEHWKAVNTTLDMGVAAHVGSISFPENWVAFWTKDDANGSPPRQDLTALSYRVDGEQTFVDIVDIASISHEQDRRLSLSVEGSAFRGFDHDTAVEITGTSPLGSGQTGVSIERGGSAAAIVVKRLFIMMSSRIQMRGVPATWTWEFRTLADTLIAAFPGSTTTIDVLTDLTPPPTFPWLIKVQVRDELGALHRELIPADGVWGGDEYHLGIGGEWSSGPAVAGSWASA